MLSYCFIFLLLVGWWAFKDCFDAIAMAEQLKNMHAIAFEPNVQLQTPYELIHFIFLRRIILDRQCSTSLMQMFFFFKKNHFRQARRI